MTSARRPGTLRPLLATAAASFLLGAAAVGYYAWTRESEAPAAAFPAAAPASRPLAAGPAPSPSATASEAARAVAQVQQQQGGIDQRLAAAEQRIARLDLQRQAAAGNAARAEGLLIAFASRRALEKGAELGYLADQLRLRFGDAMPRAVATVIAAAQRPVTLDQLVARLDGLTPRLADAAQAPFLDRVGDELAQLFVVRRESAPSPQPQRRLERARLFLQSGRVDAAIAEVERMPGATEAQGWVADARRYAEAQRALDLIETAAVLEPTRLRDGGGASVAQPSPVETPAP